MQYRQSRWNLFDELEKDKSFGCNFDIFLLQELQTIHTINIFKRKKEKRKVYLKATRVVWWKPSNESALFFFNMTTVRVEVDKVDYFSSMWDLRKSYNNAKAVV